MKRLAVLLVAGLTMTLPLLAGCGSGGSGGGDSDPPEELFPGTWRVARIQAAGQSTACPGELTYTRNGNQVTSSCGADDTVTFFENGAFTGTSAGGGAFAGTWQFSGDTLTITVTAPPSATGVERERIAFSGDDTFTSTSEQNTVSTFERE
jgi:hypothetical protein